MAAVDDTLVGDYLLARFIEVGCTEDEALVLVIAQADWHEAERLVARGCDPRLLVPLLS